MERWFGGSPRRLDDSNSVRVDAEATVDRGRDFARSSGVPSGPRWSSSARVSLRSMRASYDTAASSPSRRVGAITTAASCVASFRDENNGQPLRNATPLATKVSSTTPYTAPPTDDTARADVLVSTSSSLIDTVPRGASSDDSSRGVCGVCGHNVLVTHRRVRDESGAYFHQACTAVRISTSGAIAAYDIGARPSTAAHTVARVARAATWRGSRANDHVGEGGGGGAFGALPDELVICVLRFLTHRELLVVGTVCRLLRRVAADRALWGTTDLGGSRLSVDALTEVGLRATTSVSLARCVRIGADGIKALLRGCGTTLQSLSLAFCRKITGNVIASCTCVRRLASMKRRVSPQTLRDCTLHPVFDHRHYD